MLYLQGVVGTTYVDTGVVNGTTYYYQVSAANGVGESNLSQEVSATPLPPLPAAPTSLTAAGINDAQISLSWQESSANVTGFTLERVDQRCRLHAVGHIGCRRDQLPRFVGHTTGHYLFV